MQRKPWEIGTVAWRATSATDITVELFDIQLYPALEQFASDEGLNLRPSEVGRPNEYWIGYSKNDIERAQMRLEQYVTNLYWELKWSRESQFKIGDKVQIIAAPTVRPGAQPIFVQMYDEGVITKIIGFDLYVVTFENSGTISGIPSSKLQAI